MTVKHATRRFYRHRLPVRLAHWINAICLFILLLSGFQIFNAHPALYWGAASDFDNPWLAISYRRGENRQFEGYIALGESTVTTTGIFGVSENNNGKLARRAFPDWLTIPSWQSLAMGRQWHFFFAWLLVINAIFYLIWSAVAGHFRDIIPTTTDWRGFGRSIMDHLRLKHPVGEAARHYNILQKLAYLVVIFLLGGAIVVTGLCMSPRMNTVMEPVLQLMGGRQSARSLHFITAAGFILFVFVHLFEVVITGLWNNLRSMISGNYDYPLAVDKKNDNPRNEQS